MLFVIVLFMLLLFSTAMTFFIYSQRRRHCQRRNSDIVSGQEEQPSIDVIGETTHRAETSASCLEEEEKTGLRTEKYVQCMKKNSPSLSVISLWVLVFCVKVLKCVLMSLSV